MSVGPILTLGLGAFTGGGFQYIPTLGYGTSGTPPAPADEVIGGAGHPVYARRRKWRELRNVIDEGLQAVYQELAAAGLPVDVMGEAVKIVKPFADKRARFRSTVKPSEVDWAALQRDAELSRRLLEIYEQHVGEQAWARMLEEEDEILLLN